MTPHFCKTTSYFDCEAALDRCCGDEDFLAEMVDLLATSVATQLAAVDLAIAASGPQALGEAAHALKGAVASMTTARPYKLAYDLELLGKTGTCDHAETIVAELRLSLDQLLKETQQWSASRGSKLASSASL